MKLTALGLLVWVLATGPALADPVRLEALASPLEGSRWQVEVTPAETAAGSGERPFEEMLVFEGGRVRMNEFVKAGFEATPYSLVKSASGWSFRTEQTSRKKRRNVWTAEIQADVIQGRLTCTGKDGTVLSYTFEGRKVGEQGTGR